LSEKSEERPDALRPELDRGRERGIESLTGEKAPDRPARETPPRNMGGKPLVLRAPQEHPSHQAHKVYEQVSESLVQPKVRPAWQARGGGRRARRRRAFPSGTARFPIPSPPAVVRWLQPTSPSIDAAPIQVTVRM